MRSNNFIKKEENYFDLLDFIKSFYRIFLPLLIVYIKLFGKNPGFTLSTASTESENDVFDLTNRCNVHSKVHIL